jgi:hypothetical membrane protein
MNKFKQIIHDPKFSLFGMIGVFIIGIGCAISAIFYRGPTGQLYSLFNYFISELGGVVESEQAIFFNGGVFLGGILLVIFLCGLYVHFPSKIGKAGCIVGVIAGINGALVGLFPYDVNILIHAITAFAFFYGGMLTTILLSIALFLDKNSPFPKYLGILGLIGAIIFGIFNFATGDFASVFSEEALPETFTIDDFRPSGFWAMAFFEWLSLLSILLWMFIAALELRKINLNSKSN